MAGTGTHDDRVVLALVVFLRATACRYVFLWSHVAPQRPSQARWQRADCARAISPDSEVKNVGWDIRVDRLLRHLSAFLEVEQKWHDRWS